MEQVEAAKVFDFEVISKITSEFRRGEQMKAHGNMPAIPEIDFTNVLAVVEFELNRLLHRSN